MKTLWFLILCAPLFAQQLVVPKELNREQQRIYQRLTQAVSAPCCSNAIPVAYHESPMAISVRNNIRDALLAGKSEEEVRTLLDEMRFGETQAPLIYAVPDQNSLGALTWWLPAILIVIGIALIYFFMGSGKGRMNPHDEQQVVDKYADLIRDQARS